MAGASASQSLTIRIKRHSYNTGLLRSHWGRILFYLFCLLLVSCESGFFVRKILVLVSTFRDPCSHPNPSHPLAEKVLSSWTLYVLFYFPGLPSPTRPERQNLGAHGGQAVEGHTESWKAVVNKRFHALSPEANVLNCNWFVPLEMLIHFC